MACTCKAGLEEKCKHVHTWNLALLLHVILYYVSDWSIRNFALIHRFGVDNLDKLPRTDKPCSWKRDHSKPLEQYKPVSWKKWVIQVQNKWNSKSLKCKEQSLILDVTFFPILEALIQHCSSLLFSNIQKKTQVPLLLEIRMSTLIKRCGSVSTPST